jgi:hypothetical protein
MFFSHSSIVISMTDKLEVSTFNSAEFIQTERDGRYENCYSNLPSLSLLILKLFHSLGGILSPDS